MSNLDQNLEQYATATQWKYYTARCETSIHLAAKKFNVTPSTITSAIGRMKRKAVKQGYSPEHDQVHTAPIGQHTKGVSTLYDADGQVKVQWVKTQIDKAQHLELLEEAVERIADPFKGQSIITAPPDVIDSELINVIPFGDPHIGLYTWAEETGEDFDCDIAENVMVNAVDYLIESAPKADTALIINLGDFFHADTVEGVTSRAGNKLDVDTRWARVLEIGVRIMRRCIDKALTRHKKVVVINAIGNHDDHSAQFLSIVLREYYHNNPRVEVRDNKTIFQYYQFGKNLFGVTHGHTVKPLQLEGIMAHDCADIWSDTCRRKWFVGHFHSQRVHEARNCLIEYYRNTAPCDAWHTAAGYRSIKDMRCETWHSEKGHMGTTIFDPLMMS